MAPVREDTPRLGPNRQTPTVLCADDPPSSPIGLGRLRLWQRRGLDPSSQLERPNVVPPLDQLARAAHDGAMTRMKGKPADGTRTTVNTAVRETIFRFELVLRIINVTGERLVRQMLLAAACSARLALLFATHRKTNQRDAGYLAQLLELRDLVVGQVDDLHAIGAAREAVERRYLAGHPALFPDAQADRAGQVDLAKQIGLAAVTAADKGGVASPTSPDPADLAARIARHEADLVEPARVVALEQVGEASGRSGSQRSGWAGSWQ